MENGEQLFDIIESTTDKREALRDLLKLLEKTSVDDSQSSILADQTSEKSIVNDNSLVTANDFHNNAVKLARIKEYDQALEVCIEGLKRYPRNVDLLADSIEYSSEKGDFETAQLYFDELCEKIPRSNWNWRAFSFSIDFLMNDVTTNKQVLQEIIEDYCRYLPNEERAIMARSEFEEAIGNHQNSIAILAQALKELPVAPQCALRLADKQLELGKYEDVIQSVRYGLMASAEIQPSINISYLFLIKALAEDAILHRRVLNQEQISADEIDHVRQEYSAMLDLFPKLSTHRNTIILRAKMLDMLKTEISYCKQNKPTNEGE